MGRRRSGEGVGGVVGRGIVGRESRGRKSREEVE